MANGDNEVTKGLIPVYIDRTSFVGYAEFEREQDELRLTIDIDGMGTEFKNAMREGLALVSFSPHAARQNQKETKNNG